MRMRISLRSLTEHTPARTISHINHHTSPSAFRTAVQQLTSFVENANGRLAVLTGAGVSTDSGVPDYRGEHGTYTTNPDYQPVFYQAFRDSEEARHRYWARSFLGFPNVAKAQPNPTHYSLAAMLNGSSDILDKKSFVSKIITQNVDSLFQQAQAEALELHGTLHSVHCINCGHIENRTVFQEILDKLNPDWSTLTRDMASGSLFSRMNADGDVDLDKRDTGTKLSYTQFQYPACSCCGGIYKPSVVFFGENIPKQVKDEAAQAIHDSEALLVMGTSLATFSAFRLVQLAKEAGKPIAMVNLGRTRGDDLADLCLDMRSSEVIKEVAKELGLRPIEGEVKDHRKVLNVIGS